MRLLRPVGRSWATRRVCRFGASLGVRHDSVWSLLEAVLGRACARKAVLLVVAQVVFEVEGRRAFVGAAEVGSVDSRLRRQDMGVGIRAVAYRKAAVAGGRYC